MALLFSTSEPLAVKDVQAVITRFHAECPQGDEDEAEAAGQSREAGTRDSPGHPPEQALMRELLRQVPSLLTATQIRQAFEEIREEGERMESVWCLREGPRGYALVIAPQWSLWVRLLRGNPRPRRLSSAQMETLAVVAYRQPVTRAEIEAIRGVSVDNALARLLERELIKVTGRAELPGRPIQYGTTTRFLEFVGLRSLDELPVSDVLAPHQLSEWIRRATHPEAPPDDGQDGAKSSRNLA